MAQVNNSCAKNSKINGNSTEGKINFMYTNVRSLMNKQKRDEIGWMLENNRVDILGITESWTHEDISDAEINFSGFTLFRRDRKIGAKARGGGVVLYIRDSLSPALVMSGQDCEGIWAKIKCNGTNGDQVLKIGLYYRGPNASPEECTDLLESIRQQAIHGTIIMGDFNYRGIDWNLNTVEGGEGQELLEIIEDLFLTQHVRNPTRGENILDLVISSEPGLVDNLQVICPVANSDHNVITWSSNFNIFRREVSRETLNYNRGDFNKINEVLKSINWKVEFSNKDTSSMWESFTRRLLECTKFIPKCIIRKKKTAPWIKKKLVKRMKIRNKKFKEYNDNPDYAKQRKYRQLRNQITGEIRRAKKEYEYRLAERIKEQPKAFYSYVNSKRLTRDTVGPLTDANGNLTDDDEKMSSILNDYFSSVFTQESINNLPVASQQIMNGRGLLLTTIEVTEEKVLKALIQTKSNKAAGIDGINSSLLKESRFGAVEPLTMIFKTSIEQGVVPEQWKRAEVTPIFKKGSKKSPGNYRPISLTCQGCKVLEKIIKEEVVEFLENNGLFYKSQHGFRRSKSCLTNLIEFMENALSWMDEGSSSDVLFIDLQKAFDKVPHQRLLIKLRAVGIEGQVLKWIEAWLEGRKQRVILNGSASNWTEVFSGVPQGSVLGPVLFIIYINDIDELILSSLFKFADDAKLLGKVDNQEDIARMQKDLASIIEWSETWQMPINTDKCKVMHFGKNNNKTEYTIGGHRLEAVSEERDLGVQLTEDLKVGKQCLKAAKKGNQILGMIRRTFSCKEKSIIMKLYKSLVRPHLDYCVQAWRPHYQKDINTLEAVQKRATRMVTGLQETCYESRLKELGLTTLETRRIRADMLEVFKIMKGIERINADDLFEMSTQSTRGHKWKFYKKSVKTDYGKFKFSNRVVTDWNNLPTHVVEATGVNDFKGKLDHYLRHMRGLR